MRLTPSLPQRGRQTKGSIPLDPLSFSCFWREFIVMLLMIHITTLKTVKNFIKNLPAPPYLGEALMRGNLVN
jgi:hypothetical protein